MPFWADNQEMAVCGRRRSPLLDMLKQRLMRVAGAALAILLLAAGRADAQMFGVGARMTSVSGPESPALENTDSSRTRFWGGYARVHFLDSVGFEVAMDYQSLTNDAETARVRNTPIQVSALLLNPKKTFAPYLLGGLGWYKHKVEALDQGKTVASAYSTDFGYHLGGGLQLKFGRHMAVFADYRYVWVDADGLDGFSGLIKSATSLTSVLGLVTSIAGSNDSKDSEGSIDRGGSMWTGGLTIYF
jgi:opacity protein-like surface antigen